MDKAKDNGHGTLLDVLDGLRAALARLDEVGAPADIGAHLSSAIERLEIFLDQKPSCR